MALIRVRRGSTAAWELADPILASGEPGYDETLEIFKVGNGVDVWTVLPGIAGSLDDGDIAALVVNEESDTFEAIGDLVLDLVDTDAISANTAARHTHSNSSVLDATQESFTTTLKNKLDAVEASADVTDATNVASAGAVMTSGDQTVSGTKTFSAIPVLPASSPSSDNQAARKKYVDDGLATKAATSHTHDVEDITDLVSADADNAATVGSDGGVFAPQSAPPGDYATNAGIETLLKYAAPVWVLEANEDETDLPGDFPDAPFFTGGPPPIVLRKKDE